MVDWAHGLEVWVRGPSATTLWTYGKASHHGGSMVSNRDAHFMEVGEWRKRRDPESQHIHPSGNTPNDLIPPVRLHMLNFPPLPRTPIREVIWIWDTNSNTSQISSIQSCDHQRMAAIAFSLYRWSLANIFVGLLLFLHQSIYTHIFIRYLLCVRVFVCLLVCFSFYKWEI